MKRINERMEHLINFGQKVIAVEFQNQIYFIVESGMLQGGDRECQKDFYFFDEKSQIGHLYLSEMMLSKTEREEQLKSGVKNIPDDFFALSDIEIDKKELHGKGLGSVLLNWATKEMLEICKRKETEIPLLFVRINSEETLAFYEKWGAVPNQVNPDNVVGSNCSMIIERLKTKSQYDAKIVAVYEKPSIIKEDRSK